MATLYITEYGGAAVFKGNAVAGYTNELTTQTVSTSGASAQSAAFNASTKVVRIKPVGGAVHVTVGSNPTATTSKTHLGDGEVYDYCGDDLPGLKVAVIDAA